MLFTIKVALLQLSIIGIDYGNITICSPFYCTGRKKNKTFNVASEFFMCFLIYRLRNTEHQTILDVLSKKLSAFFSWFGLEEYIMYVRQYYNGVVVFCARRAPALTNKLTAKRRISFWINKLFTSFLMNPYGLEVRDLQCIIIMQSSPYVYSILIKLSWRQKYTLCLRYFVTDFMMLLFSLTSVCLSHFSKAVIWTGNCFLQKNSAWGWFSSL